MINLTVGPVQMDKETREIGSEQVPYFRTPSFSEMMKENERLLCELFDAPQGSRSVFLTGSGTASMEAGVINFFTKDDKVLVVNGGSFGHRLVDLCSMHDIPFVEIKLDYGKPLLTDHLEKYNNQGFTGFLVQLCETSTGVLYDMNLIGDFCHRNGLFLFVDAISGFMADKVSMKQMHINAVITGSQKALSLPPGMSFTVLDPKAIEKCLSINPKTIYFNYPYYLKNGERGQTPFTPAVSVLIQLNEKLKRIIEDGGIKRQNELIAQKAAYFRERIKELPFKIFTELDYSSNCVTALCPTTPGINAYSIFQILKDEYGIWICPNGGELADKVLRVGHIGSVSYNEIDTLISCFEDLKKRNLI